MQFQDNLEIPGVILDEDQSRGWTGVLLYRRQVLKLAREMVFKGEHGRNHDCKGSIHRYQRILYQGISYYYKKLP